MRNKELLKSVLEQTAADRMPNKKRLKGKLAKTGLEIAGGALIAGAAAELGKTGAQSLLKTIAKRTKKI
jgi:hypothetical protein